jgi:glycosyltransferase involved in cell wall biosynthesis
VRILYHHRTRAGDAQGIHIHEIVRAFRELGHEVRVAALAGEGGAAGPQEGPVSRALRAVPSWVYEALSLGYNMYGYRRLVREGRDFRPDLLYERYALNTFCGVWAARRLGVPMILEVNAPLAQEQEQLGRLAFRRFARFSERWICSRSTRTIVVTGVMRELLAEKGVPRRHMTVMPNGIDPERFHPDVSGSEVRRRHGLEGTVVVGFVGWFRKWHGLEMLLDVFARTDLASRRVRLLLVGDGPARPDLDRIVAERGLGGAVAFTGPVPHGDIPAHVAAMDVALQPSAPAYACPMKIIEYLAMGKCVVAPDQPNIRELVDDGESALLFRPEDAGALARALETSAGDVALRSRIGSRGLAVVRERGYLWQNNARRALDMALTVSPSRRSS